MPLGQAARMLTRMTGQNIVVSSESREKAIGIYLKNVSARAAIEGICRLNGLWYREDPEMVRLLTKEEYGRELVIRSDEQTRLYYLKYASSTGVAEMIAALMPDQVEYSRPAGELSFGHVGTDGDDPMSNAGAGGAGGRNGTPYGPNSGTGGYYGVYSGEGDWRGGNRVSRSSYRYSPSDVANSFQQGLSTAKIESLARSAADRQKGEVSGQAVAEKTGSKPPIAISVFLRNNCIGVRAVQESAHREIGKIIEALDTPTRQVLLEVKILKIALGDGFESLFSMSYANGSAVRPLSVKLMDGANTGGNTVSFSYLDKHISATMKLLENENRLHVVATPLLLCANNAPAEFFSGLTRMITTNYDYETRYAENNQAVDIVRPVVQEREIGTTVRIKPSINTDGTATLRFRLELSSVNKEGGTIYQVKSDGSLVGFPIDTIDQEKAESIVVARHGQAIVMGGLISESVSKTREQVPLLGRAPFIGPLFGKHGDETRRNETVILIVPHIIATAAAGQDVSDTVLKNNTAHPWVTHDQNRLTGWDARERRFEETDPPPPMRELDVEEFMRLEGVPSAAPAPSATERSRP
jgi:general secretion pathway protein D